MWALLEELRAENDDLLQKNAALAGSVTQLQKLQLQSTCGPALNPEPCLARPGKPSSVAP